MTGPSERYRPADPHDTDFVAWEAEYALYEVEAATAKAPLVYEVAQMDGEVAVRERTQRLIGRIAMGGMDEIAPTAAQETGSLHEAIQRAARGEATARKLVETNARTDVIERTMKSGHIIKVPLYVNAEGRIVQYGQTAEAIQQNSLRYAGSNPQMFRRTTAETRNMYRIEHALKAGLLEDYAFVVLSRAADDMSIQDMDKAGFFTDTMSCAIQITTMDGGQLSVESAFVAGKVTADAGRHDKQTIATLGERLGADLTGTATELLDKPMLLHKSMLQHGVADLVRLYDEAAGSGMFFGKECTAQDYTKFRELCAAREAELAPTVDEIVSQLLAESGRINTPVAATRRLHELSEQKLLRRAITDEKIDGRVFGVVAASFLEAARYEHAQGNAQNVDRYFKLALSVAASSSCPGLASGTQEDTPIQDGEGAGKTEGDADCEYISKKCPMCNAANVHTVDKGISGNLRIIRGSCGCRKLYTKAPKPAQPAQVEFAQAG